MCKVIAVANQKGGVGKTVTCVNLGIGLAREGYKVLIIDADPQGSFGSYSYRLLPSAEISAALTDNGISQSNTRTEEE